MNFEPHKCDFLFRIFLGHIYTHTFHICTLTQKNTYVIQSHICITLHVKLLCTFKVKVFIIPFPSVC